MKRKKILRVLTHLVVAVAATTPHRSRTLAIAVNFDVVLAAAAAALTAVALVVFFVPQLASVDHVECAMDAGPTPIQPPKPHLHQPAAVERILGGVDAQVHVCPGVL